MPAIVQEEQDRHCDPNPLSRGRRGAEPVKGLRAFDTKGRREADQSEEEGDPHEEDRRAEEKRSMEPWSTQHGEGKDDDERELERDGHILHDQRIPLSRCKSSRRRMHREERGSGDEQRTCDEDREADCAVQANALRTHEVQLGEQEAKPAEARYDMQMVEPIRIGLGTEV